MHEWNQSSWIEECSMQKLHASIPNSSSIMQLSSNTEIEVLFHKKNEYEEKNEWSYS